MSRKYRNLWVFGDSYSTPGVCVSPADSFWMQVANMLQVSTVYNYSWPGNSLDSVAHMLVSDSDQYDWQHDFFLVGIPPLVRLTVASHDSTKRYHRHVFDLSGRELAQQMILSHHGLENKQFYDDPIAVRFEDPIWTETQACRTVFLLNSWLDQHQANYLVLNLSKDFQTDLTPSGGFLLQHCLNHPRNIINCGYYGINVGVNPPADYDQYGWGGHHAAAGNRYFFQQVLAPRIKNLNLC